MVDIVNPDGTVTKSTAEQPSDKTKTPAQSEKPLTPEDKRLAETQAAKKKDEDALKEAETKKKKEKQAELAEHRAKLARARKTAIENPSDEAATAAVKKLEAEESILKKEAGEFSADTIKDWFGQFIGGDFSWGAGIGALLGAFLGGGVLAGMFKGLLGDGPIGSFFGMLLTAGLAIVGAFIGSSLGRDLQSGITGSNKGSDGKGQGLSRGVSANAQGQATQVGIDVTKTFNPLPGYRSDVVRVEYDKDGKADLKMVRQDLPLPAGDIITLKVIDNYVAASEQRSGVLPMNISDAIHRSAPRIQEMRVAEAQRAAAAVVSQGATAVVAPNQSPIANPAQASTAAVVRTATPIRYLPPGEVDPVDFYANQARQSQAVPAR